MWRQTAPMLASEHHTHLMITYDVIEKFEGLSEIFTCILRASSSLLRWYCCCPPGRQLHGSASPTTINATHTYTHTHKRRPFSIKGCFREGPSSTPDGPHSSYNPGPTDRTLLACQGVQRLADQLHGVHLEIEEEEEGSKVGERGFKGEALACKSSFQKGVQRFRRPSRARRRGFKGEAAAAQLRK